MTRSLVAVYGDAHSAESAVRDLIEAGVPRDRVHHSRRGEVTPLPSALDFRSARAREDRASLAGAGAGALVGAVLFGFLAVALSFLPGMQWILMGGDITTVLGSAAVGALLGFAAGGLGVPFRRRGGNPRLDHQERMVRQDEVVEVQATEDEIERVVAILGRHDPIEIDRAPDRAQTRRRGVLSDVELAGRQTRDRDREPTG